MDIILFKGQCQTIFLNLFFTIQSNLGLFMHNAFATIFSHMASILQQQKTRHDIGEKRCHWHREVKYLIFKKVFSDFISPIFYTVHCTLYTVHCTLYMILSQLEPGLMCQRFVHRVEGSRFSSYFSVLIELYKNHTDYAESQLIFVLTSWSF